MRDFYTNLLWFLSIYLSTVKLKVLRLLLKDLVTVGAKGPNFHFIYRMYDNMI